MAAENKLQITPETKIGELLDTYPELEETLLSLAPAFARLKSPILRRTVGRVATLGQAAKIGGIPLGTMINTLRAASGNGNGKAVCVAEPDKDERPAWVISAVVTRTVDARPMLERGEHPIGLVMKELDRLLNGQALLLLAPFPPLPLIEKARSKGFMAWFDKESEELVKTYFSREI